MANICLNYASVYGNPSVLQEFYTEVCENWWVCHYVVADNVTDYQFESRWSPPKEYIQKISSKFGVLIECEYEECSSDIGGKFAYDKGELVFDVEMSYLEYKYHSLDWNEFIECEVMWRLEDADPFDDFIEPFKEFCSDSEIEELEELFFELSNEN